MIRKIVCRKTIPGCRYIRRGETLPDYLTLTSIKGLLEPVARQRGLDQVNEALMDEYLEISLRPGSPVSSA